MRVLFWLGLFVSCLISSLRKNQVENNPDNPCQSDAAELDNCQVEAHAANTEDQNDSNNRQVAWLHEVCAGSDQGVDTNDGNRTEKQNHDATHNGYRYGIQEAP